MNSFHFLLRSAQQVKWRLLFCSLPICTLYSSDRGRRRNCIKDHVVNLQEQAFASLIPICFPISQYSVTRFNLYVPFSSEDLVFPEVRFHPKNHLKASAFLRGNWSCLQNSMLTFRFPVSIWLRLGTYNFGHLFCFVNQLVLKQNVDSIWSTTCC